MSTPPDSAFDLDLHFLPAWAQQPANKSIYTAQESGETERHEGRRDRRDRPPRRDQGGRPGPRGQGQGRPGGPPRAGGPRPGGDRFGARRPQQGGRHFEEQRAPRPEPIPLPDLDVQFRPEEAGVDSLARQIKMTGRAYPLFGVAQLILERPERHSVILSAHKKPDGAPSEQLFACALDDTVWLSEDDAVRWVLDKHFATFYQAERTQTDPPKGTYTFVAQCGISGAILGPPNYHDYQNQLRKLHAERFSRMPFDVFKARVKIVRDEETVKKWIEDQSWKTEYSCLNVPEPLKLSTRDDVEKHFRQTHLANIIKPVESHKLSGTASRALPCRPLHRLVRTVWEDQTRFPLQLATTLSQQFASRGLQFFKVNKTVTHVAVARPHYLDLETNPVSDNIRKVVEFINAHPKCTRRQLFEALAPAAAVTTKPAVEGEAPAELSPEASAVITDLHWLVHQGHVIEFANGTLETAKKPMPKPVRPEKPAAAPKQDDSTKVEETSVEEIPAAEATPTPESVSETLPPPETAPETTPPAGEQAALDSIEPAKDASSSQEAPSSIEDPNATRSPS